MKALLVTAVILFGLTAAAFGYLSSTQERLTGEPVARLKVSPLPENFDKMQEDVLAKLRPPLLVPVPAPAPVAAVEPPPVEASAPLAPEVVIPGLSVEGLNEPAGLVRVAPPRVLNPTADEKPAAVKPKADAGEVAEPAKTKVADKPKVKAKTEKVVAKAAKTVVKAKKTVEAAADTVDQPLPGATGAGDALQVPDGTSVDASEP